MRLLPVALVALVLVLSGCSSDDADGGDSAGGEPERVGLAGISFDLPEDWTALDSEEMTEGAEEDEQMQEYQERLGMSAEQLRQTLDAVDLYLVSGEGAKGGFLDNIVGTEVAGSMPNESQLQAEVLALGAEVISLETVDTEAGEAARLVYELPSGETVVKGQALSVPTDGGVASISVSATESDTSAALMDGILGSLATD